MALVDTAGYAELALPVDAGAWLDVDDPEPYVFRSAHTVEEQQALAELRYGDEWVLDRDDPQEAEVLRQLRVRLDDQREEELERLRNWQAYQAERRKWLSALADTVEMDLSSDEPAYEAPVAPRPLDYLGAGAAPWAGEEARAYLESMVAALVITRNSLMGRPERADDLKLVEEQLGALAAKRVLPLKLPGPVTTYPGEPLRVPPLSDPPKIPTQYNGGD